MNNIIRTGMAVIAITALTTWVGCKKNILSETTSNTQTTETANVRTLSVSGSDALAARTVVSPSTVPVLCGTSTVKNFLKNTTTYGTITVGNDATDYYITISGLPGSTIKGIQLYAGTESGIPVNSGNGMPKQNDFPVQESFSAPYPAAWSLKIPISEVGDNFWISVKTSLMTPAGNQALWSEGTTFPPSNVGSKFQIVKQTCIIDEGCGYGQGYWFGNGNQSWPDVNGISAGNVTIGSENYTRAEARAIWWANNGNCPGIPNAKKAFAFVASIRLNGASIYGNESLWMDVMLANTWLESLERLSPDNICDHPAASAEVMAAVGRIGDWLEVHNCE